MVCDFVVLSLIRKARARLKDKTLLYVMLYDYDMTKPNTRGKGAVSKGCDCAKKIIAWRGCFGLTGWGTQEFVERAFVYPRK